MRSPRFCIFCNQELDEKNRSVEHIIPRCMGGKLKSNLIICKKCNNNFGTEFDEALIERFALILHPVRLFNPHLKIKDVTVELRGVKYLLAANGISLKDPYQKKKGKGFLGMVFPNEKSLIKHLKKKKKKDPTIDIQKTIEATKREKYDITEHFDFEIKNINNEVYRCCGKICYEFLFHNNNNYKPSSDLFSKFVLNKLEPSDFPICIWYGEFNPLTNREESIYHVIVIEGRKDEQILIAYLNVFNCLPTLMILDKEYTGPTFLHGYYQDLLSNTQSLFTPSISIPLTRQEVVNLIGQFNPLDVVEDYVKSVFETLDNSRFYPIKRELALLIDDLPSRVSASDAGLLAKISDNLVSILDKYGLFLAIKNRLEEIKDSSDHITFLTNISIMIDFLLLSFKRARITIEIFEKLSQIIQ